MISAHDLSRFGVETVVDIVMTDRDVLFLWHSINKKPTTS